MSILGWFTVHLTNHMNGNHIIQYCLKIFSDEDNTHILRELADNCLDIATKKLGCCVLQHCLAHSQGEPVNRLVAEIAANALVLSKSRYGNHIMQFILAMKEPYDKRGCLYLQKKIEKANPKETEMLFFKLKDHVHELMITQILLLVISDERYFTTRCCDTHRTHAMQKLLEYLNTQEQKYKLMSVLGWFTVHLTNHMSGNHEEPINRLVAEISTNALLLSESRYGNYVMQFILAMKEPYVQHAKEDIFAQLAGKYVSLSFNKYNSNVVERCLKKVGEDHVAQFIKEIINSPNFLMLVQDPYGKYVTQSAVMVSKGCVCQIIHTLIVVEAEGKTEWSRALSGIIEEANPEETEMLFFKLKDHVRELMEHQFGNSLIQKFFGVCNSDQIAQILLLVISDERYFMTICCNTPRTHAMQKLLEYLTTQEQKYRLISVLGWFTIHLTNHMNGNHVIQYCLKIFSDEDNMHILHELLHNCLDIATEKSGCCVLQHCLAHSQGEPINRLVTEIAANGLVPSKSHYGNYVMQFILAMIEPYVQHAKGNIFAQCVGNYVSLSFNKYRNNVVEKCLKEAREDQAAQIIKEITNSPNFLMLLQYPYGKCVAQSAMMVSKGCVCQIIFTLIEVVVEGKTEWSRALRGIVFLVAKDKRGCLYLQKKMEEANLEESEMLFFELKDPVCELMVYQFGNSLIRKFFRVFNLDQITQILLLVISDERYFMTICCDTHGTHAM
ncbi:hypothetical protein ACSBR2_015501 [Camellia fascicularis]